MDGRMFIIMVIMVVVILALIVFSEVRKFIVFNKRKKLNSTSQWDRLPMTFFGSKCSLANMWELLGCENERKIGYMDFNFFPERLSLEEPDYYFFLTDKHILLTRITLFSKIKFTKIPVSQLHTLSITGAWDTIALSTGNQEYTLVLNKRLLSAERLETRKAMLQFLATV